MKQAVSALYPRHDGLFIWNSEVHAARGDQQAGGARNCHGYCSEYEKLSHVCVAQNVELTGI